MNKKKPEVRHTEPVNKNAGSSDENVNKCFTVSIVTGKDVIDSSKGAVDDPSAPEDTGATTSDSRSETNFGQNEDESLYDSQEGTLADWRTVNFRVPNVEFVFSDPQDGAESGGGSVPPPRGTDTSSDSDVPAEDPEHLQSQNGGLSVVHNKFNSEQSEQSEQSETFFYKEENGFDRHSSVYPDELWKTLEEAGSPYFETETKSGEVRITGLNSCFFGKFSVLCGNMHYYHGEWYAYRESKGYWKALNVNELLNLIHFAVLHFGQKMQLPGIEKFATKTFCMDAISFMMPFPGYESLFDWAPRNAINVKNGTILIDRDGNIVLRNHSPIFLQRSRIEIDYDPTADYSKFVEEAFAHTFSPADTDTMQKYSGQLLFGKNLSQTILLIYGKAGCGKSTYVQLVEKVLPPGSCEGLRTGHLDERFELSRFENKNVLIAPDEASDALMKKGASKLKALSGADILTTERKCKNEHSMIRGEFNIILTSNARPTLFIDDDRDAWRRRLVVAECKGTPPTKPIRNYADRLFKKYETDLLAWMVDGGAALRRSGDSIIPSPEMICCIDEILQESDPAYGFVKTHVVCTGKRENELLSRTLYTAFVCTRTSTAPNSKQSIQRALSKAMEDIFGATKRKDLKGSDGKAKYGYVGYLLIQDDPE